MIKHINMFDEQNAYHAVDFNSPSKLVIKPSQDMDGEHYNLIIVDYPSIWFKHVEGKPTVYKGVLTHLYTTYAEPNSEEIKENAFNYFDKYYDGTEEYSWDGEELKSAHTSTSSDFINSVKEELKTYLNHYGEVPTIYDGWYNLRDSD